METQKVKCTCQCHTVPGILHNEPCCDNGWIEIPVIKNRDEVSKDAINRVSLPNRQISILTKIDDEFKKACKVKGIRAEKINEIDGFSVYEYYDPIGLAEYMDNAGTRIKLLICIKECYEIALLKYTSEIY